MPTRDELEAHTVAELRDLASEREIPGRSKMDRDALIAALDRETPAPTADTPAESGPPPTGGQTVQQEAVNDRRVGLDPTLAEIKAATRAREADLARPSAVEEPVRVVGAEAFERARAETRKAEADAAGTLRDGRPTA